MTFPALDLTGLDLSRLDPRQLELPLPAGAPGADQVVGVVRDTAYVSVGLLVLGVQRVRWERRQLEKRLRSIVAAPREHG